VELGALSIIGSLSLNLLLVRLWLGPQKGVANLSETIQDRMLQSAAISPSASTADIFAQYYISSEPWTIGIRGMGKGTETFAVNKRKFD
jgi:hypothetical protein